MKRNKVNTVPVYFETPVNRAQVRKLKKENAKNFPLLMQIEDNFLLSLFNEECKESYAFLYQTHLEVYQKMLGWMKGNKMFKLSIPNDHYFEEKFYPVETFAS